MGKDSCLWQTVVQELDQDQERKVNHIQTSLATHKSYLPQPLIKVGPTTDKVPMALNQSEAPQEHNPVETINKAINNTSTWANLSVSTCKTTTKVFSNKILIQTNKMLLTKRLPEDKEEEIIKTCHRFWSKVLKISKIWSNLLSKKEEAFLGKMDLPSIFNMAVEELTCSKLCHRRNQENHIKFQTLMEEILDRINTLSVKTIAS